MKISDKIKNITKMMLCWWKVCSLVRSNQQDKISSFIISTATHTSQETPTSSPDVIEAFQLVI